ncbi:MAG: hydroxyphenylacetyl-CoA thioesterase PaaI [Gemmatimonadetes bacterium]|nr:hydroxyphenylacetyl-CoA thioesterase PaaI [Gemmatimonadota bacterium]
MTPQKPTAGRRARTGVKTEQIVAERVVGGMMAKDEFSKWMGMSVVDVRPRTATVRMTVRAEMVNGFGVAHGGVAYSLADSALAFASNTHGKVTVAINNAISYPAAVNVGDVLTAVADSEGESRRLGYYRVVVRNQDDAIVATFTGTVYKTKDDHGAGRAGETATTVENKGSK